MQTMEEIFLSHQGKVIHKFPHYMEIYDRHFAHFRGKPVCIVEIGVGYGGSLQLWKKYFGSNAEIYGIDISLGQIEKEDPQIFYVSGDQGDREFLKSIQIKIPKIDILIDDGSHRSNDQIITFESLFPLISNGGIYLCEDLQTSYQEQFGGGFRCQESFIEYGKRLIDQMNAWCANVDPLFQKTDFTRAAYSINFYPFMMVIEKRLMDSVLRSPMMIGG